MMEDTADPYFHYPTPTPPWAPRRRPRRRGLAEPEVAEAEGAEGHGHGEDTAPGCHPVCEPEPIHSVEYVRTLWVDGGVEV